MEVEHDTMHGGRWQRYTIRDEDTTVGHLVRHHLLPLAHYASCATRHPLEERRLQICLQATPTSGRKEADKLLQQACRDAMIELDQFQTSLDLRATAAPAQETTAMDPPAPPARARPRRR